jgi:hypothetical protein
MPRCRSLLLVLTLAGGLTPNLACAMKTDASDPAAGALAASPAAETRLGSSPVTVNLPAPADERLSAATARGKHLYLAVDGLQVLHPGAVYQVYLDLPAGSAPDPQGPYFVGNLSLYTDLGQTAAIRRTYDVTEQVKALRQRREWKGPVRVTFVQERLGEEAGAGEPAAFLRFTQVSLVER